MKSYLVILAMCNTSPVDCTASDVQASLFEYPRLVDCVRARETIPQPDLRGSALCTGEPFDPRKATLG